MKKIIKTMSIVLLLMLCAVNTFAEEYTNDDYTVTYDGKDLSSNFSAEDIAALLADVQPGDSAEITFTLINKADKEVDWYMENSIQDIFKDAGGGYDYSLTYTPNAGSERDLLDQTVGGDNGSLEDLNGNAREYFYLERLGENKTSTVTLRIELDGETQLNTYQTTDGVIRVKFAVEEVAEENPPTIIYVPNTGDNSNLWLYVGIEAMAFMMLIYVAYRYNRYRREA